MSWRTRWRIYEYIRNSIWIVPAAFAAFAIALGIVMPQVDEGANTTIGISFGPDAARNVLGSLAGGMITFTGFVCCARSAPPPTNRLCRATRSRSPCSSCC